MTSHDAPTGPTLTADQAAQRFGVGRRAAQARLKSAGIQPCGKAGRANLYPAEEIEALAARYRPPQPPPAAMPEAELLPEATPVPRVEHELALALETERSTVRELRSELERLQGELDRKDEQLTAALALVHTLSGT